MSSPIQRIIKGREVSLFFFLYLEETDMKNWYSKAIDQTGEFKNFRMTIIRKKCIFCEKNKILSISLMLLRRREVVMVGGEAFSLL